MRFIKRLFFFVLILFLFTILFKGFLYRSFVDYNDIGSRGVYLIEKIPNDNFRSKDIDELLNYTLNRTSEKLEFKLNNPGKFMLTGKANCVGYSDFYSSYINQLLLKNDLGNEWKVYHKVGKLELFGIDVHQYFSSPSFKDHDFVVIENFKTKEIIAIDPALYDYTGIKRVTIN